MDIKEQIINLISPDKEKYAIELVDYILSLIHQEIENAIPKEDNIKTKYYVVSQTDAGYEIAYRKAISDIRKSLKEKGLL